MNCIHGIPLFALFINASVFEVKITFLVPHGKSNTWKWNKAFVTIGPVHTHCGFWKCTFWCKWSSKFLVNSSNKIVQKFHFKPLSNYQPFLTLQRKSGATYCHPESLHLGLNTVKTKHNFIRFGILEAKLHAMPLTYSDLVTGWPFSSLMLILRDSVKAVEGNRYKTITSVRKKNHTANSRKLRYSGDAWKIPCFCPSKKLEHEDRRPDILGAVYFSHHWRTKLQQVLPFWGTHSTCRLLKSLCILCSLWIALWLYLHSFLKVCFVYVS